MAIFQRGAADGLNIVVPFAEKRYREMRVPPSASRRRRGKVGTSTRITERHRSRWPVRFEPRAATAESSVGQEATGDRRSDRFARPFALALRCARLHGVGNAGQDKGDGWLNRALPPATDSSPLRAIAMGAQFPRTLRGDREAIAVNDSQQFTWATGYRGIVRACMRTRSTARWRRAGKDAFAAMKMIHSLNRSAYNPARGAQYGQGGELGRSLQQMARLIKADAGVEAAFAEIGGWDHHGTRQSVIGMLRQFGGALSAFSRTWATAWKTSSW